MVSLKAKLCRKIDRYISVNLKFSWIAMADLEKMTKVFECPKSNLINYMLKASEKLSIDLKRKDTDVTLVTHLEEPLYNRLKNFANEMDTTLASVVRGTLLKSISKFRIQIIPARIRSNK